MFIEATDAKHAEALARDKIERDYGLAWYHIYFAEPYNKPQEHSTVGLTWDYAIGQESIRIETVSGDEVLNLIAELPIGQDAAAIAICNAHNASTARKKGNNN